MMNIVKLLTLFLVIFIQTFQGKILRSSPLSNLCPEYFTYNEKVDACEIEIPSEYDDITIDDITGHCINGKCPEGHKCIDKKKVPFCVQHFATVQEAIDHYNKKEL